MPRRAGMRVRPGLLLLVLVAMLAALTGASPVQGNAQCPRVNPAENKTELHEHREIVHRERAAGTVLLRRSRSRWFRWYWRLAMARPDRVVGRIRPFSPMGRRDSYDDRMRKRRAPAVLQVFRL